MQLLFHLCCVKMAVVDNILFVTAYRILTDLINCLNNFKVFDIKDKTDTSNRFIIKIALRKVKIAP